MCLVNVGIASGNEQLQAMLRDKLIDLSFHGDVFADGHVIVPRQPSAGLHLRPPRLRIRASLGVVGIDVNPIERLIQKELHCGK